MIEVDLEHAVVQLHHHSKCMTCWAERSKRPPSSRRRNGSQGDEHMAKASLSSFLENIQPRQRSSLSRVITDTQLLKCFLKDQDESAFELLMWRHGPIV